MKTFLMIAGLCAALLSSLPAAAASRASLSGPAPLTVDKEQAFTVTLTDARGHPLTPGRLKTLHTRKVHLLIIDDGMTDYRHVHPEKTAQPGVYSFSFTPRTAHGYTVWADFAVSGSKEEYIPLPLAGTAPCKDCVGRKTSLQSAAQDLKGALSFDDEGMLTLKVTDAADRPVAKLEPVMGAFAHLVGFYADGSGVIHIHPMGDEPESAAARGGPELMFHLAPEKAGTVKMFAQVKVAGGDVYLPFTLDVTP